MTKILQCRSGIIPDFSTSNNPSHNQPTLTSLFSLHYILYVYEITEILILTFCLPTLLGVWQFGVTSVNAIVLKLVYQQWVWNMPCYQCSSTIFTKTVFLMFHSRIIGVRRLNLEETYNIYQNELVSSAVNDCAMQPLVSHK